MRRRLHGSARSEVDQLQGICQSRLERAGVAPHLVQLMSIRLQHAGAGTGRARSALDQLQGVCQRASSALVDTAVPALASLAAHLVHRCGSSCSTPAPAPAARDQRSTSCRVFVKGALSARTWRAVPALASLAPDLVQSMWIQLQHAGAGRARSEVDQLQGICERRLERADVAGGAGAGPPGAAPGAIDVDPAAARRRCAGTSRARSAVDQLPGVCERRLEHTSWVHQQI